MDRKRLVIEPVERIGNIIPKNKVTLITGLPGTGKSYSIVKFLNRNEITPIYFNLDSTALGELKADMFDATDLHHLLLKSNNFKDLMDKVIVIDTYARFEEFLFNIISKDEHSDITNEAIVEAIENLIKKYNFTIIIIGHPEDYVGRDSIFKDNPALVRHCYEHLHFETIVSNKKSEEKADRHIMRVKKGRVYFGERVFLEWMRE